MNPIAPLIEYVRASGLEVPELERCLPAKNLVLETCVKEAWRRVVGAIVDFLFLDDELRVQRTNQGNVFVQRRAPAGWGP